MNTLTMPVLSNPKGLQSIFTEQDYGLDEYNGLFISSRIDALNFRYRMSQPGYFADWHVAGDPTLIIIRAGILRIGLRDRSVRDFSAGEMFIAKDRLPASGLFDQDLHGHTAQLIGDQALHAVHIKLASL